MKLVKDLDGTIKKDEIKTIPQFIGINLQKQTNVFTDYFTEEICKKKGDNIDKNKIIDFIKIYKIQWLEAIKCKNVKTIEECVEKFKNLNDFFIRKISIKIQSKSPMVFGSPADCRTLYMYNEEYAKKVWIKGVNYCIKCMLKLENETIINYYKKSHILISRLAPVDYHRFHSPIDGEFLGKYNIPGLYYSVDPTLINSKTDVYTRNVRSVYFINTKFFGIIALCIIGATCVGSIKLHNHRIGYKIKKGDELGYFQFGGSTIVTIIPYNKLNIIPQLDKNSEEITETYVRVGDSLITSKSSNIALNHIKDELQTMIKTIKK